MDNFLIKMLTSLFVSIIIIFVSQEDGLLKSPKIKERQIHPDKINKVYAVVAELADALL